MMSPKELSYLEDALGHETFLKTKCCDTASQLSDAELRQFTRDMEERHQQLFNKFYNLV